MLPFIILQYYINHKNVILCSQNTPIQPNDDEDVGRFEQQGHVLGTLCQPFDIARYYGDNQL